MYIFPNKQQVRYL